MPYRNRIARSDSDLQCPRCHEPLAGDKIGELPVERCLRCLGLWVVAREFNELMVDLDRQRQVLERESRQLGETRDDAALLCPTCGQKLLHQNFGRVSQVMVDTCRKHGIWFDVGELRRVVDFLRTRTAAPTLDDPASDAAVLAMSRPKKQESLDDFDLSPLVAAETSALERFLYALYDMLTLSSD